MDHSRYSLQDQPWVDRRGPVFISYRQSDGRAIAEPLTWVLRAAGIPVWHDQTDLPPGDTERRLKEALVSGLSGAVLLVTPDIQQSVVVREIELPHLLALGENPDFNFVVGSILEKHPGSGHLDYSAPDELLCQQPGTLSRLNQMPINSKADRMAVANALIRQRMFLLRSDVNECGGVLALDVQTRIPPTALRFGGHLVLRLRPPNVGERRPHYDGLQDLSGFLGQLPQLIEIAGATSIRVRGGAHLSVACAIGAAIPTTLIGTVEVVDAQGERWVLKGQAPTPDREPFTKVVTPSVYHYERGPVLIYIDLLPQRSDAAYDAFLSSHEGSFAGAIHIRHRREKLLNAGMPR